MPKSANPKPSVAGAAKHAALVLDLPDPKRLEIALAEVAAEELEHNSTFAKRVLAFYNSLQPSAPKQKATPRAELVPIKYVEDRDLNAADKLDPYFLLEVYGMHQLWAALEPFPIAKLKEGADLVEKRTGTKANRRSKTTILEYITQHVTA